MKHRVPTPDPTIVTRETLQSVPWFDLVAKRVRWAVDGDQETYYSLRLPDYVGVVAMTTDGLIPLVRQYRPVIEQFTWELPAGTVEAGETPVAAARRELREETGCVSDAVTLLGCTRPDTGRLENRLWCYFASDASRRDEGTEPGIEVKFCKPAELRGMVEDGTFDHAMHVGVLALAMLRGHLNL